MRKFKCNDCGHTWELPFGQGVRGMDQVCPECGSKNVHRVGGERGRGRGGRGWGTRWDIVAESEVEDNDT